VWLLVGLGARGLVYHAWLGQLLAQAVLSDSEQQLPQELLAWREQQPAAAGGAAGAAVKDAE
jgi:glycine/D-amino acid oxidase-like deaminating enzyme